MLFRSQQPVSGDRLLALPVRPPVLLRVLVDSHVAARAVGFACGMAATTSYAASRSTLVLDATGVGLPVVDVFKSGGVLPIAVSITGGLSVRRADQSFHVPKRELIRTTVALLESGHLRCPAGLSHLAEFTEELLNFGVRINRRMGRDSYEARGSAKHDDLVLAVSLACWCAKQPDRWG